MTDQTQPGFVHELNQRLQDRIEAEPELMMRDAFVSHVGEHLIDDGTLDDLETCYLNMPWQNRRVEVAGYDITSAGTILHLVVAEHRLFGAPVKRDRIDQMIRRVDAFADFCRGGNHELLERSSPAYDMAQRIHEGWPEFQMIRIFVLTDGTASIRKMPEVTVAGLPTSVQIWDLTRIQRLTSNGGQQEEILINLSELGYTVQCLESPQQADGYRCLLAVLPGRLLADLYHEHHSRILQRNVRAFLQARGKVNKGIAETIQKEPGRFLAYNNGVSATAKAAKVDPGPTGPTLRELTELQIVNGGQTTASLHHAAQRGLDLSEVHVPAKITLISDERLDPMIPDISRYANSQNAVTSADFEGNSPFHVGLERLSRSLWTPADSEGKQQRWYYERVRGQYDVDRGRNTTPARRRQFDLDNPRSRRFGKTDAAKYEYASERRPDVVCLGGQKCFLRWTEEEQLDKREAPAPDYFRHLVAKAIVFNEMRSLIQREGFGGYLGQTTAYTVSLINERLGGLDLNLIWRMQRLPDELAEIVLVSARAVRQVLINPPGSGNVTEWCKKPDCWESVRAVRWEPPAAVRQAVAAR
ncbi:AIPR family protein [Saccharopolyspora shandongensis]|uniref:AIPR family protein n=1 Tax=Saccharopolyspora shandongensis TaxID=418495 RepID=UPI0034363B2D